MKEAGLSKAGLFAGGKMVLLWALILVFEVFPTPSLQVQINKPLTENVR